MKAAEKIVVDLLDGKALKENDEPPANEVQDEEMALIKDLAHKSGLFGTERSLRWLRSCVGRRIINRVEIARVKGNGRPLGHEGRLKVHFDRGTSAFTTFCSFEVLKMTIRQWRNIYGAPLIVNGKDAGTVSYSNPALADDPPAAAR